jgi:spore coat protein U-like protein
MNRRSIAASTRRPIARALALVVSLASASAQASTTCSAVMTNIQFGSSDPFTGWTDVTATINYSCTITSLLSSSKVRMCFSIGSGAQGTGSVYPRQMTSGSNSLLFNLYKDSSYSQIWGTRSDAYDSVNQDMQLGALIGSVTDSGSLTVYGRIPSGQTSVIPGAYTNSFSGIHTELVYRYNEFLLGLLGFPATCTSGGNGSGSGTFEFTASATVQAQCNPTFSVQNVDFGTHGLLNANIDTTATISPQCTNTTSYQIGLDDGLHASGTTRRMQSGGGQTVSYELYRDAGRSLRWGNTQNTDTLSGTGSGSAQALTVYSRVSAQSTPTAGSYSDTVTVTIYY